MQGVYYNINIKYFLLYNNRKYFGAKDNPFGKPRTMIPVCNRCVEDERASLIDKNANSEEFEEVKTK